MAAAHLFSLKSSARALQARRHRKQGMAKHARINRNAEREMVCAVRKFTLEHLEQSLASVPAAKRRTLLNLFRPHLTIDVPDNILEALFAQDRAYGYATNADAALSTGEPVELDMTMQGVGYAAYDATTDEMVCITCGTRWNAANDAPRYCPVCPREPAAPDQRQEGASA